MKSALTRFDKAVRYTLVVLALIWGTFIIQYFFNINHYGIIPREVSGLKGIFFSPFLHGGIKHLWNNTLSFIFIGLFFFYFYQKKSIFIFIFGTLLTGLFTWLIADIGEEKHVHIGLSGAIYFLTFYMFLKGIYSKTRSLQVVSLILVFLYGSMIWGILPLEVWKKENISWEGHLSGAISGLFFFLLYKNQLDPVLPEKKYNWQIEDDLANSEPYWMPEYWEQKRLEEELLIKKQQEAYQKMLENWS